MILVDERAYTFQKVTGVDTSEIHQIYIPIGEWMETYIVVDEGHIGEMLQVLETSKYRKRRVREFFIVNYKSVHLKLIGYKRPIEIWVEPYSITISNIKENTETEYEFVDVEAKETFIKLISDVLENHGLRNELHEIHTGRSY